MLACFVMESTCKDFFVILLNGHIIMTSFSLIQEG